MWMYIRLNIYKIYSFQADFHNCSLLRRASLMPWKILRMPLPHVEKKWKHNITLPLLLSVKCLSLSLRPHASQCITSTCSETDKSSDRLTVRISVQQQLPTQNKLPSWWLLIRQKDLTQKWPIIGHKDLTARFSLISSIFLQLLASPTCLSIAIEISKMAYSTA